MGILDVPGLTRLQGDERYATKQVADLITGQFPAPDVRRLNGPVASGPAVATVNPSIAPDSSYNRAYTISGTTFPSNWPVDIGDAPPAFTGGYVGYDPVQPRMFRFMADGTHVVMRMHSGTSGGQSVWGDFYLYVDGAPVSLTAYSPPDGNNYTEFVFPDARPRLIEVLTCAPLQGVYTKQPYRCWMPPKQPGVKALLVGDSYSQGVTPVGGTQAAPVFGDCVQGWASLMGVELGVGRWSSDAKGGTGYIKTNGAWGNYNTRRAEHIAREPDVLIVGGGGANDLFASSVADITTAAITYFTEVRNALPDCKLIFMEGFTPPLGFGGFGPSYIQIRQNLQAALTSVGVYYIDTATSAAWLDGTGYVGATTGVGNNDIYTGNDGVHLSPLGNRYIQKRLAPKFRAAIADNGELLNTLI